MRVIAILVMFFTVSQAGREREFIFTAAPFESCHASTVVELRNGDIMAAWFGGSAEGNPDVAIWVSRRTAGGWSAPAELVREPEIACYNPVLFYSKDGRVVLVYNHADSGRTPLNLAVSEDGEHFRMFHILEDQPGEYSYPAIVQGKSSDLHITYTWNRKRIRYVRFPLADVPG